MIDNWWVTRPKRRLDSIPENLATFCSVALGKKWVGERETQIAFEDAQELNKIKREGGTGEPSPLPGNSIPLFYRLEAGDYFAAF